MQKQITFSDFEDASRKRVTKREEFLNEMDKTIPWDDLVSLVKPYYYKGKLGRKPIGIETMLRMYFLQIWFNLSDEGVEDTIYDSRAFSHFMKISFGYKTQAPDATTLLKFRKIIVNNKLDKQILDCINSLLSNKGVMMRGGSIVDATFIDAPTSTKNKGKTRDKEMHSAKKGSEWHFGMKAHIGVDAGSGLVHTTSYTAANIHDITETHKLVRSDDNFCYADSGYLGIEKRDEVMADEHLSKMEWHIASRPSSIKGLKKYAVEHEIESRKASIRSKVEHPFLIVKRQFGYRMCRYKGIDKNASRLNVAFALANIVLWTRSRQATLKA